MVCSIPGLLEQMTEAGCLKQSAFSHRPRGQMSKIGVRHQGWFLLRALRGILPRPPSWLLLVAGSSSLWYVTLSLPPSPHGHLCLSSSDWDTSHWIQGPPSSMTSS